MKRSDAEIIDTCLDPREGACWRCNRCGTTFYCNSLDVVCPYCPRKPVRIPGPKLQTHTQEQRNEA